MENGPWEKKNYVLIYRRRKVKTGILRTDDITETGNGDDIAWVLWIDNSSHLILIVLPHILVVRSPDFSFADTSHSTIRWHETHVA